MPLLEVTKHVVNGGYAGEGLEGDELEGGNVVGCWICTSDFDQPRDNALRIHGGLDEAPCPNNPQAVIPVVALASGRIENARRWNGISGPGGSYGNVAIQRFDDGEGGLYGHLARFADRIETWLARGALAEEAPYVERGELIGYMGNTGNVWPTPETADDKVSGKHLHFELRSRAELGSVLLDPETRLVVVDGLTEEQAVAGDATPPEVNPNPNTPLDLGLSAALDEALLLRFLAQSLLDVPIDFDDALAALEREVREFIEAFGPYAGAELDEARVLAMQIATMRTAPGAFEYGAAIERVRDEIGEQVAVLRLANELRLAS